MAEDMKTCTKCGETKPLDGFHRDKSRKDGRQSQCKACQAKHSAAWRQANPEYSAAWREANPEYFAEYRAANPHVGWESLARQRAKQFGYTITVESFTREQLIERYGDQCFHCGGDFEELDHYPTPIRRGGHHVIDNCKPSCKRCNQLSWRNDSEAA